MGVLLPVIVILLALLAAGSIVFIAWELTSRDTQEALERKLGRPRNPDD